MRDKLKGVDKFKIADTEYDNNLAEDLYVNSTMLAEAFSDHAEKFAWYATAHELASDFEIKVKTALDRLHATLYNQFKAEAVATGAKITEKGIESRILTDMNYMQLQDQHLDSKRQLGLLKAARDAMIHRKDMLVSAGSTYRAELQADVTLKASHLK